MNFLRGKWAALTLAGFLVAAVFVVVLLNLRSPQPVQYRVDLTRRGSELRTVTLYYLQGDSLKLVPIQREVLSSRTRSELARDLVVYLAENRGSLRAPLPEGTRLLHFFENESGQTVMNFNAQIEHLRADGIREEQLCLDALIQTLGENVPGVKRIRLLVLGRPLEHWGTHLSPSSTGVASS